MDRSFVTASVVVSVAVANLLAAPQSSAPDARTNTVFVTATQENGAPVADLVAADFTIKEDGKPREVLRVEPANAPAQIAIIVDDNGTGIFRAGLVSFVRLMQGRAELSLSTVVGQTQRLLDYTTDVDKLTSAIVALSARPGYARWRPAARRDLPGGEGSGEARSPAAGHPRGDGRRRGAQHASGTPRARPAREERYDDRT